MISPRHSTVRHSPDLLLPISFVLIEMIKLHFHYHQVQSNLIRLKSDDRIIRKEILRSIDEPLRKAVGEIIRTDP